MYGFLFSARGTPAPLAYDSKKDGSRSKETGTLWEDTDRVICWQSPGTFRTQLNFTGKPFWLLSYCLTKF
jgi:hypothetical protein